MYRLCTVSIAIAMVALGACSYGLRLVIHNHSGSDISVLVEGRYVSVVTGSATELLYPGDNDQWKVRLVHAGCALAYDMPQTLDKSYARQPGYDGKLVVELNDNLTLRLLPPAKLSPSRLGGKSFPQTDGFPLRPTEKHCKAQ